MGFKVSLGLKDVFIILLLIYSIYSTAMLISAKQPIGISPSNSNAYNDCGKSMKGYDALFFYSPFDKHSHDMIEKVKSSGLKFYWINVYNERCKEMNLVKYGYVGWVPYFYCLHNGLNYTGEMNNYTWSWFVEKCK